MTAEPVTIVAIDGPSGVGKSTVGREVARRLSVPYVDTGAMYRAVGLALRRRGLALPLGDPGAAASIAEGARVDIEPDGKGGVVVRLDGEEVTSEIRDPEIALYASAVSAIPAVRRRLVALQREIGRKRGGVLEGRDIGTVVFPETPHKFFLTASAEVRARRRLADLEAQGRKGVFEQILAEQQARDLADSTRADSPLTCDDRYRVIDTGELTQAQVVERILGMIRELSPAKNGDPTA
jgi:cytidylate kinase